MYDHMLGHFLCHIDPLCVVLYMKLVVKNHIREVKEDILTRQVVLPIIAFSGENWKKPLSHCRNIIDGCICGEPSSSNVNVSEEGYCCRNGGNDFSRSWLE